MTTRENPSRSYSFRIHAVSVCVNFDDFLSWTLPQNIRHFDSFTIVTTQADAETQQIVGRYGAAIVRTERLRDKGSQFDSGAAINDGLEQLQQRYDGDWFCIVDADMILPWNLREVLEKQPLDSHCIYGIVRGLPSDEPISGFFQLLHASQRKRYREGHHNAGYTDTWFRDLWLAEQQITLPDLKAERRDKICRARHDSRSPSSLSSPLACGA